LKKTAKRIKGYLRETDIISRVGGDEFMLILDDQFIIYPVKG